MATDTFAARGKARWYPRQAPGLLAAALALVALAIIAIEVVMPLSAGLPIGWGQYSKAEYHLRIGTPPFWNVTADTALSQGAPGACAFAVVVSPNTEPAQRSTSTATLLPRWISVAVDAPCAFAGSSDPQASLWTLTGQRVVVAGQPALIAVKTIGAPQVSYRVGVTLHGYSYTFMLTDPSATLAQRDLPDFLTLARSFRYIS